MMDNEVVFDENAGVRLWWLMFCRVAIVSFLLGVAVFIQIKATESLSLRSAYSVYYIIALTYFLSIFYALLFNKSKNIELNINIQSLFDVILITVLVYVTGGIESVYSTLYPLVIIYTVLFLGKRGGIFIASVSSILYGLLLDLEFYNIIHPFYSSIREYEYSAGYVFSRIFIYIVSFYIIAFLASFVVEREKKVKVLLSQKESDFDQLDLLHRSIIESVDTGIMTTDLQGTIKSFNRAAEDITGYRFYEVKNKNIDDIFPGISLTVGKSEGRRNRFEIAVPLDDDRSIILGFSISSLIGDEGENIGQIMIFQDLTSIKKMEAEVEKTKRLALIGEMSAILAHELRNPLASLSGSIEILQRDLELKGTDKKLMDIVLRGKDQLETLVKDFLLMARPSPENHTVINVKEIMDGILESARFSTDWNNDIAIEIKWCDNNDVYGNKTEIRQALWNIVVNAVQAMPDGGNLTIVTSVITDDSKGEFLQISVEDTGVGIEKKHRDQILEPFYTTKERGTGLGLAIVDRVVKSHEGRFSIESEVNKGSKLTILLPRQ